LKGQYYIDPNKVVLTVILNYLAECLESNRNLKGYGKELNLLISESFIWKSNHDNVWKQSWAFNTKNDIFINLL